MPEIVFCLLHALCHQRAILQFSRKGCCLGHLSLYWPYTFTSWISSFSLFKMCLVASNAEVVWGLPKNTACQGLTQTHWERGNSGTRGTLEIKRIWEASKSKQFTVVFLESPRIPCANVLSGIFSSISPEARTWRKRGSLGPSLPTCSSGVCSFGDLKRSEWD